MNATLRRLVLLLLHLSLFVALWTTALSHLSDRPTAVSLLTSLGTQVVNPVLTPVGKGVDQTRYQQLQQEAQATPDAPLVVPGLKTTVRGNEILGLSYDDGTRVIYSKVAAAYYDGGASAAFDIPSLPTGFANMFTDYGALANYAQSHGAPVTLPAIPTGVLGIVGHVGLSPDTLTATEHQTLANFALLAWVASLLLGLVLFFVSRRWGRLSSVSLAVFDAALPGVILLGLAALVVSRDLAPLRNVSGPIGTIGGAFIPVYIGAAAVGLAGLLLSVALRMVTRLRYATPRKSVIQRIAPPSLPANVQTPELHPTRAPAYRSGQAQYPSAPYNDSGPADPNADTVPF